MAIIQHRADMFGVYRCIPCRFRPQGLPASLEDRRRMLTLGDYG
jgi:hypothetical protein